MADANYSNVALLIPGVGANNSTGIYDYSKYYREITADADTKISTAQSKFYGSSIKFPGTTLRNLFVDNRDGLLLLEDTAIWTIRCWVYLTSTASTQGICATREAVKGFSLRVNSGGTIQVLNTGVVSLTTTATLSATTWHHIEIVRNSGTLYMFVDGALDSSTAWSDGSNEVSQKFVVGDKNVVGGSPLNGYLNDFEVTVGVARHTAAFTAPTQFCPSATGVAKIGGSAAYQVRGQSVDYPSGAYSPVATPEPSGNYTLYTADVKQTLICHHDDPTGTVTATPEAAVVEAGGTANFYGVSDGANNVGGINSILLSTL